LLIALGQAYWRPIQPRIRPGSSFAEVLHAIAEATLAVVPERRLAAVGRWTGTAYTLTHEELRARVREVAAASYAAGAQWLRSLADEHALPMPPDVLVRVIHALSEGLVFQRIPTEELVPDEVFYAAFAALAPRPEE
jgi:hypothetical protein